MTNKKTRFNQTAAVRAGIAEDAHHGAVVPPIHLSSTFGFEGFCRPRTFDYTRSGNPTRQHFAGALAEIEGGAGAVVTSTGMSAIHLVLQLLDPEDLVLAPADCYGGTHRLLRAGERKRHFRLDFADLWDPSTWEEALAKKPKLVWIETPSNPLLRLTDIEALAKKAKAIGALVAVDNTFLSPALQRPLSLGADLVVHSTTKYINGHSDVVGGAVVAANAELCEELAWWANCTGITGAPFDSYLALRGLRTLGVRMKAHLENAIAVAELLENHPAVHHVYYPGLKSHPQHELAAAQQDGFGAIVSFELAGGTAEVEAFVDGLRCFTLAESLGGVESLVAHPATMTHASMDEEARARAGIKDSLLRLSVGIEEAADLVADLREGLQRALDVRNGGLNKIAV